ncbi:NYN domain-containing protein [uncultured Campylobacter sp.]|uniref:NYN domain-containing protein n=1 Tax=uncultured Campylobacter sp. TaxID=218934 RepID=UPI00261F7862|nr:NYN domain-containing protein [uncultured Campylobacter sp.]
MDSKKLAVLIDVENISAKNFDKIWGKIASLGKVVLMRAYGDWSNLYLKSWLSVLEEYGIMPVHHFCSIKGKNASDIVLVIDAMDLLHRADFDSFVLVSNDSDFTRLAIRIKESGKEVIGIGDRQTSKAFLNACTSYISLENQEQDSINQKKVLQIEYKTDGSEKKSDDAKNIATMLKMARQRYAKEDGWINVSIFGALLRQEHPELLKKYKCSKISLFLKKLDKIVELKKEGNIMAFRIKQTKEPLPNNDI